MIPIELTIEGFRSYREPVTLDFSALHRACIVGPNGSGKSTIVTAMLWALFGRSRQSSSAALINSNSDSADVKLSFESEGERFLIRRSLKKRPKRSHSVFLYRLSSDGKELIADTVRTVASAVSRILNINYEDFVSASVLLQGESDRFSTMSPAERKTMLARILGLSLCDDIAKLARSRTREIVAEKNARQEEADRLGGDAEELESAPKALEVALEQHDSAKASLDKAKAELASARREKAEFDERMKEVISLKERIAARQNEAASVETELGDLDLRTSELEGIIAERRSVEARLDELQMAKQRLGEIEIAANRTLEAREQIARKEGEIEAWRGAIVGEIGVLNANISSLQREIDRLDRIIDREPEMAEAHREFVATSESLDKLRAMERRAGKLSEKMAGLRATISAEEKRLRMRFDEQKKRIDGLKKELEKNSPDDLRATLDSIDAEIAEIDEAKAKLEATRTRWRDLDSRKTALEVELEQIEGLRGESASKLDLIRGSKSSKCPLCGQPLGSEHRARVVADMESTIEVFGARIAEIANERKALTDELSAIEAKGKALNAKCDRSRDLEKSRADILAKLRAAEKNAVELEKEKARFAEIESELQKGCAKERATLKSLEKEYRETAIAGEIIRATEARIESLREKEIAFANLPETKKERRGIHKELEDSIRKRDELKNRLASESEIASVKKEIDGLKAIISAAKYSEDEHLAVKKHIAELADAEGRIREIEIAESKLNEIRKRREDLRKRLESARKSIAELSIKMKKITDALPNREEMIRRISALERGRDDRAASFREAAVALSQARAKVAELEKTEKRISEIGELLNRLAEDEKLHRLLADAMGKNGVPAFVISHSIPEIEREADDMLALLSGDEMSLRLSASDDRETLELRIADLNGERPYDSYSGGESFRVDFALRVAFSRFLAHRSGAELSMLIIDEGFGTQDSEGLALLIESLRAIEHEFALILVITHLENLKGEFDQVIEVKKTASTGSSITAYT